MKSSTSQQPFWPDFLSINCQTFA